MRRLGVLIAALTAVSAIPAQAQVGRDVAERGSNRKQISQGQEMLERDSKELEAFSSQLTSLEQAVGQADDAAANQALSALLPMLKNEVEQGGAKGEAAKKELAGAASETGSNRRESRRSRDDADALGRTDDDSADVARDAVNRADDARDAADDKKDLEAVVQRTKRQQEIAQTMAGYQFVLDSEAGRQEATKQVAMLKEFDGLMRADLAASEEEIKEDKREAGEDRRETRDDVREADEIDNRYRRKTGNVGRRR